MKKIEYLGIMFLFGLSLFYTDKISNIVKNNDPVMKSIIKVHDETIVESVNAQINDDEIIPGKTGCEIDVNESYKNMKIVNKYSEKMLKYKDIIPEITLNDIYNKYISSGNKSNKNVSIVIYLKNNKLDNINKNIKLNIFLDSKILTNDEIKVNGNEKIYNGGDNLSYDDTVIEWGNDVIENSFNKPNYCLNLNKDDNNLLVCGRNRMHSITPKVVVNDVYNSKMNIRNGSIIYFNENNIDKLELISDYLIKKGFNIVYLDELLNENICSN